VIHLTGTITHVQGLYEEKVDRKLGKTCRFEEKNITVYLT